VKILRPHECRTTSDNKIITRKTIEYSLCDWLALTPVYLHFIHFVCQIGQKKTKTKRLIGASAIASCRAKRSVNRHPVALTWKRLAKEHTSPFWEIVKNFSSRYVQITRVLIHGGTALGWARKWPRRSIKNCDNWKNKQSRSKQRVLKDFSFWEILKFPLQQRFSRSHGTVHAFYHARHRTIKKDCQKQFLSIFQK